MKFKTKPKFIEANQFDGTITCMQQLKVLFPQIKTQTCQFHEESNRVGYWQIKTISGLDFVSAGDWVCLSENGISVKSDSKIQELYEPF